MRNSITILLVIVFIYGNAQENKQSAFTFNYSYQVPLGNLSASFGENSTIGSSYFLEKTNNILFGFEANYLFGSNVKESTIFVPSEFSMTTGPGLSKRIVAGAQA